MIRLRAAGRTFRVGTLAGVVIVLTVALRASSADPAPSPLRLPQEIPQAERQRLEAVAASAFASTRVEGPKYFMHPEVFEFLLDHPDFATQVSRALGLGRYRVWRERDGLWFDDGWGARAQLFLVHAAHGVRLYYARGGYEQRYLPEVRGDAVALFEYSLRPLADGRTEVTNWSTGYVQADAAFIRIIRYIAPSFIQARADKEASRVLKVFARASNAIETDPAQVYQKVKDFRDVSQPDLEQFRILLRLP
jgi:hypothetical protein